MSRLTNEILHMNQYYSTGPNTAFMSAVWSIGQTRFLEDLVLQLALRIATHNLVGRCFLSFSTGFLLVGNELSESV